MADVARIAAQLQELLDHVAKNAKMGGNLIAGFLLSVIGVENAFACIWADNECTG